MVDGINKLQRRLVDALPKQTRAQLEIAMTESAALIAAGARLRVPVETGELRDTIHQTEVREGKRGGLYVAIVAGKRTPNNYNTARIVEFGTISTPAQPFLLPSFRANRKRAQRRMRKAIVDAIRKEGLDGR
jgi:HK97 gp10 family phage protein